MSQIIEKYIGAHPSIYDKAHNERRIKIAYAIPNDGENCETGILFLLPGYGGNIESNVYRHIREDFSDAYNLIVVQCEYFGSSFMQERVPEIAENLSKNEYIEEMNIKLKTVLEENVQDFNDMGLMQALDIVATTLYVLENIKIVNTNRIILFGHSHGAYLAHLANIICPQLFSYIIDISGYIIPYYLDRTRVLGYVLGDNKVIDVLYRYMITERKSIRYNKNLYNLSYLYNKINNHCHILAIQGTEDWMVDYTEKRDFIKSIPYGDIMMVTKQDVDGVIFKDANHGCGLDYIKFLEMVIPIFDKKISMCNDLIIDSVVCIGDELQISYEANRPKVEYISFEE